MTAKIKTVIVSSDPTLLGFLQQNLDGGNYELVCTNHTGEGLKAVLEKEPADLVILDIIMPGLDGIEVCLKIRQWSRVPIMMLSAWGAGEGKVRGLNLSASSYLTDPFGIDELTARIRDTLQRNLATTNLLSNTSSSIP